MPPEAWRRAGAIASATCRTSSGRGTAGARAVEIDEMDRARAPACREAHGELDRVAGRLDDLVVVAPVEAHGALAEHVDGGYHLDRGLEPFG